MKLKSHLDATFFFFIIKNCVFVDLNKTFKKLNIGIDLFKKMWYNNFIIPKGYLIWQLATTNYGNY